MRPGFGLALYLLLDSGLSLLHVQRRALPRLAKHGVDIDRLLSPAGGGAHLQACLGAAARQI